MKNVLHYKGYSAKPEYSAEDQIFYGKVLGIDDLVDFYTENSKEIEKEFHAAVDDYLEYCKEIGKQPEKEFNGAFNIRISPELHKKAYHEAVEEGISLNKLTEQALKEYLSPARREDAIKPQLYAVVSAVEDTDSRPMAVQRLQLFNHDVGRRENRC